MDLPSASPIITNALRKLIYANRENESVSETTISDSVCEIAHEFDDVSIRVETTTSANVGTNGDYNSFSLLLVSVKASKGAIEDYQRCENVLNDAYASDIERGYLKQIRVGSSKAEIGCDVTLEVDLRKMIDDDDDDEDENKKEETIERVARLRNFTYCGTLRASLSLLMSSTSNKDSNSNRETIKTSVLKRQFVTPTLSMYCIVEQNTVAETSDDDEEKSCTVVFPMHFNDQADEVVAKVFLAQFSSKKNAPRLSAAPFCAYHKTAPLELTRESSSAIVQDEDLSANAGYISFVLFPRHVKTKRALDDAVWSLASFPCFIKYHLKCSKAHWHSKMRKRTDDLLQVLKLAATDQSTMTNTPVKKKLISGRTFVHD